MTYLQPKNHKNNSFFLGLGLLLFIALALANVFLYNQIVGLQHLINSQQKLLEELRLANADLKNQTYQKLEIGNLKEFIEERGLIKINNPDYLSV